MLEYKSIPVELKDLDTSQGIVTGYWAAFGNWDDGGDMIDAGAFKKTIRERGPDSKQPRVKFLFNHDRDQILGVPQVLKEDDRGLYFESKIIPTTLGQDMLKLYEAGVITEHSIGYDAINVKYDEAHPTAWGPGRVLKELRLWDGSAVTWGMNSATPTLGMKAGNEPEGWKRLAAHVAAIERVLRGGTLTDETCIEIEREAKALSATIDALRAAQEPDPNDGTTPNDAEPQVSAAIGRLADSLKATITTFGGNHNG